MTRGPRTQATHHNTETQAQGAGEKATAFFDTEVALPWQHADEDIAADDGGTDDTRCRRGVFARSATIARHGEKESKQAVVWRDEPMPLTMHNIHPRVSLSSSLVTKAILAPRPHNQSPYSPLIAKHEGDDVLLDVEMLLGIGMVENRG